jgi:cation:H+ antiporter
MLPLILFITGFVLLIKGADWLVSGASSVASRFGVSSLVIGLTIVAFGTSAPELVVNLIASWQGNTDIAIGNIVGSNIANILLILGISALIYPLAVQKGTVWKEIPFALLAIVILTIFANDMLIDGAGASAISRIDGLALLGLFIIFIYYVFGVAFKSSSNEEKVEEGSVAKYSTVRSTAMILGGFTGLVVGGKWIVDGAVTFAGGLGVSESLIGLTIVAVGTSLPELATSAVAAYKKNVDIAVGNVVGSNIFNVFWILGLSAIIKPLPFDNALNMDMFVAVGATLLLFLALFVGRKHVIERWQGGLFVLVYIVYTIFLILRG